ncbi:VIT family protein [Candidatus Anstonella stagnisolia]|nr:VIT family protein [Candidatus Anstonella stagnisolia]
MSSHNARHLQDVILGGQDGLVNVLGLSLGVVGATADPSLVIVSGAAAMFAESISMGAVAYTSTKAALACEKKRALEADLTRSDIEKILSKISPLPSKKLALVRSKLLSHEEEASAPFSKALKVCVSTMIGSFIPLFPYFLLPVWQAAIASILLSMLVLFFTGALKAKWTIGDWKSSGFEMLAVGTLAAIAGYIIGVLLRVPV